MSAVKLRLTLIQKDGDTPTDLAVGESRDALLEPARPITIGRGPSVDIHVDAPSVGRQVVRVELQSDGVWIYDLGSGGGSRLDSVGVITDRPRCPFPDDAILWIGQVAFRVEIGR